jgi:hypothetical protein
MLAHESYRRTTINADEVKEEFGVTLWHTTRIYHSNDQIQYDSHAKTLILTPQNLHDNGF